MTMTMTAKKEAGEMRDESYKEAIERRTQQAADRVPELYPVTVRLAAKYGLPAPPRGRFSSFDEGLEAANELMLAVLSQIGVEIDPNAKGGD